MEAITERIESELALHPQTRHLVLVMSAVSSIDTSALYALGELNQRMGQRGLGLHLAEVKGPVLDRLRQSALLRELHGQLYLSTLMACEALQAAQKYPGETAGSGI